MSEENFPPNWGKVNGEPFDAPLPGERQQALSRVNAAIASVEQRTATPRRRLTIERDGDGVRAVCPCGVAHPLNILHINLFCRDFNRWLEAHSWCMVDQ